MISMHLIYLGFMMKNKYQAELTKKFVGLIESGTLPWQCPWVMSSQNSIPENFKTNNAYSGLNIITLWIEAKTQRFGTNQWLTFNQVRALGGNVIRGSKSTPCFYYNFHKKSKTVNNVEKEVSIPFLKTFNLFNLDQIEGIDKPTIDDENRPNLDVTEQVETVNRLLTNYCDNTGFSSKIGGERAFYNGSKDILMMPEFSKFKSHHGYIGTLMHELVHSTNIEKRLDRESMINAKFSCSKQAYAQEELVAELGSAFLLAELNVQGEVENHASYLDAWLTALKNDVSYLFKASSYASKAVSYLNENFSQPKSSQLLSA